MTKSKGKRLRPIYVHPNVMGNKHMIIIGLLPNLSIAIPQMMLPIGAAKVNELAERQKDN